MKKVKKRNPIKKIINDGIGNFKKKKKNKEDANIKGKKKNSNNRSRNNLDTKKEKTPIIKNNSNIKKKDIINKKKKNNKNVSDKSFNTKEKEKRNNIKNKTNANNKRNKPKRKFWKKILTFFLILGITGILLITLFFGYIVITAPKFSEEAFDVKDQTVVYDKNGDIIAKLGVQRRESVVYDDLPQVLIDAIIATEDSRFFQHNGVDLPRFIKATLQQVIGHDGGGASTLTMQTVKNNLTKKDKKEKNKIEKIIRKFQDVYLAVFKVEKEYSKEQIIELYVNNYGLGSNVYGVGEASKYYFGKSVSELTLPEASLIAGLFQAPGRHNPYLNIDSANKRRDTVLYLMRLHNYITKEEEEIAKKIPISNLLVGTKNNTSYQGFIDVVTEEVSRLTGDDPYTVPMKIYTTMEKNIQDGINGVLSNDANYWKNDDLLQAGIAVVNVNTGAISAVGNGRNRSGQRIFNYATGALKQPGSTAKPIFDYGPGIEFNNFSSYTLFNDEPWGYTDGPMINNWDGGFQGLVTTRRALQVSRNIPALKAFQRVGPKNSQKFAYSLGLDVALNSSSENYRIIDKSTGLDNTINEAYAIGGVSEGFTPLDMAAAYSGFASGGYYTEPYSVTKIEYRETSEIKEFKSTKTRVMKDSTAYIINNILESAVAGGGFAGGANVRGSHVAAKTGTTNYTEEVMKKYHLPSYAVNDLWTVAYTPDYSVAVWYGYDSIYDKESDRVTYNTNSGNAKEKLVQDIMKYIPKNTTGWKMPSSVVASQVEFGSWPAKLPSAYTPKDLIITEYFIRGTQPSEVSKRFDKLNNVTNVKTVNNNNNSTTLTWDYVMPEVLTTEYLKKEFSNSLYGKQKDKYLNDRINYNKDVLGDIVFSIYKKNAKGDLTLLKSVSDKKYTYTGYGNTTLVIKAEHKIFKSNASSGVEITLNLQEEPKGKLIATLNGTLITSVDAGKYNEEGFSSITYATLTDKIKDVKDEAKITYQVNDSTLMEFTDKNEFENYINKLSPGNYTIKYIVNYLNEEVIKSRTLIIK